MGMARKPGQMGPFDTMDCGSKTNRLSNDVIDVDTSGFSGLLIILSLI